MRRLGITGLNTHPRPGQRGGRGPVAHEDHCARQWDKGPLDRVRIADSTYLRCAQGWVYLCAVRDAHSRRVLGYAMGEQQSTDLVITALDMAATTRGAFPAGAVLHADRGAQFTPGKLAANMRAVQGTVSMGRAGVCWDNAMAESFWATLTTEHYYRRTFTTREQIYTRVATWIENFYNRRRIHTSLGGKPPSNTNYTKRPGQEPHKQTVNNSRTAQLKPGAILYTPKVPSCPSPQRRAHRKTPRPHLAAQALGCRRLVRGPRGHHRRRRILVALNARSKPDTRRA